MKKENYQMKYHLIIRNILHAQLMNQYKYEVKRFWDWIIECHSELHRSLLQISFCCSYAMIYHDNKDCETSIYFYVYTLKIIDYKQN